MGSQDQDGKKPAEGTAAEATPQKPPRTLRLAELKAAADRARSEVPEATDAKPPEAPQGADGAAKPGGEVDPAKGAAETRPAPAAADKPPQDGKTPGTEEPAKPVEGAELDPKAGPDNPFWKTQLGRYIREQEAATTARIADLTATISLLKAEKGKEPPGKPAPSDTEAELERELGLADSADKTETEKKPAGEKPAGDNATAEAQYTKAYLANNAADEFRKDPMFGEIQALMFNKHDKDNTFNRAWSGNPGADYRTNFVNAKAHLLAQKLSSVSDSTGRPGEKNLKGETPTAPLGVGGDVKIADGRENRPIELDEAGKKYVAYLKSKGRDPEKVMKKAFAVDLSGAGRSARG